MDEKQGTSAASRADDEPTTNRRPGIVDRILRHKVIFVGLLAVVAVAPWLIPWHGRDTAAPAADPSSIIRQAQQQSSPGADASTPAPPDIRDVTKALKEAKGTDLPVSPEDLAGLSTEPGPYQKLGRIQIPAIGLDVSYGEGVFDETLVKGPGHWPGTPMPGRPGNSVISGHRNTHTQPFKRLDELKPGDQIILTVGSGKPTTYYVTKTTIVPQEKYKDFVLQQPDDAKTHEVTLFACHPEGNPIFRIVVQATTR